MVRGILRGLDYSSHVATDSLGSVYSYAQLLANREVCQCCPDTKEALAARSKRRRTWEAEKMCNVYG